MEEYQNFLDTERSFVDATEYSCTITEPVKHVLTKQLSNETIGIFLMGIPDGVSPYVNEALIPKNIIRRLYIFSDKPIR